MADLDTAPRPLSPRRTGPLGALARAQYGALTTARARLFVNRLRSNVGVFELGARTLSYAIYGLMGLGLGAGVGFGAYALASHGYWSLMAVVLWALCGMWQAVSIALASFQDQFDLSGLLRFPVNFPSYYVLCVVFGLLDASTVLGVLGSLGVWIGLTLARPGLAAWSLACLAVFAVFNIMLTRAVLTWIDRWLVKRRSREIVSTLFVVAVVSLQLLNPALHRGHRGQALGPRIFAGAKQGGTPPPSAAWAAVQRVQAVLPPGIASTVLERAQKKQNAGAAAALGEIGLYVLLAGGALGLRLRAEYRGESLGEAPAPARAEKRTREWGIDGGPVAAVIEKDLRTLTRSVPQLYALLVPLIMVYVVANLFSRGGATHTFAYALPVCVAYALLGFAQLMYNNLGMEGQGIQSVFLYPVPVRTVMLGKNLFHGMLFLLVATLAGGLASLRLGAPSPLAAALTLSWMAFALPANLAAGNVLSITMAYRVNLGRLGRQSGSQANGLLSLLIQMTVLGVGAGIMSLCALFDRLWLAVPILLALAVAAVLVWLRILRNADAMANDRR
ncbi:MAG TPA: hypothetical protein VE291_04395, partial [Terracidiphilus sp.]|nr:hypothetical protein [Terracidiphilus sp.]